MNTAFKARFAASILTLAFAGPLCAAEGWTKYKARPGSSVKIDGTSTIHDWTVETKLIGGWLELGPKFPLDPSQKPAPGAKVEAKAETFIMVNSIKSGTKRMDEVMYETMHQETHPKITYSLQQLAVKEPQPPEGPVVYDATGVLTVSNVSVTNKMDITFEPQTGDKLIVKANAKLKMTDFGLHPPAPSVGLGLIKTGDDVSISLEWVTAKSE